MKKIIIALAFATSILSCETLKSLVPTQAEVANGLKQALSIGVNNAGKTLTGSIFNNDFFMSQLLPQEAVNIVNTARQLGFGSQIDQIIGKASSAAVNTVNASIPIFLNSITQMNISDAYGILKGGNGAGTRFLKQTSSALVTAAVQAEVNKAFALVGLKPRLLDNFQTKSPLLSALNIDLSLPLSNIIANKIFQSVESEENNIRNNISARTTPLLQKVFAISTLQNIKM